MRQAESERKQGRVVVCERMADGVDMAGGFYASPRGAVAGALVGERLRRAWPELDGMDVLGLGYAAPYLPHWPGAARRVAVVPGPVDGGLA